MQVIFEVIGNFLLTLIYNVSPIMSVKKPTTYGTAYFYFIWFPKKKKDIKPQTNIYLYLISQKYFKTLLCRIHKKSGNIDFSWEA